MQRCCGLLLKRSIEWCETLESVIVAAQNWMQSNLFSFLLVLSLAVLQSYW